MKIAVFGSGGVGGYIGGRLAQAGNDVTFVARKKHLDAIVANGLQVKSINGDFLVNPAKGTDCPGEIGTVDLVLCCVKSWQVSEVADEIRLLVGPETVVMPIQNGVEAHATLSKAIGAKSIVPGLCKMISMVDAPGIICHAGVEPYLSFGELDGHLSSRVDEVAKVFADTKGLTVNTTQNILQELWLKFMLIAPWSGLGALTRSPIGIFRSLDETRDLLLKSIREVFDVARAIGVDIAEKNVESTINFMDQLPPDGIASMQRDILEGRPSELDEQCGTVVRYGEKGGVQTPVNRFIYYSLLPLERRARGEISF